MSPAGAGGWRELGGRTGTARGLVQRTLLPPRQPLDALIPGEVPDRKRRCLSCEGKLNRDAGFCPHCGQEYSFVPALTPGMLVAGKYEVQGTLAFGGFGWVYLAFDTVLARWVVLKGLLNARDPSQAQTAIKEREFLAAVKHPAIVGIYDFITHEREGFIVMEFINGYSLIDVRRSRGGPLPVPEAISYILDILPAFAYLAGHNFVYCDFKLENAMVEDGEVKLIDLGAMRDIDDSEGDIFGSRGYAAPELTDAPSPLCDLYSVARALAVLVADFDFQGAHEYTLPSADELPVFAEHPALYRLLLKATRDDPAHRFQSATELAQQLNGVLYEELAGASGLGLYESALFEPAEAGATEESVLALPLLRLDLADPATPALLSLAGLDNERRRAVLDRALDAHPRSLQALLLSAATATDIGDFATAEFQLRLAAEIAPDDWRLTWYRGQLWLTCGSTEQAITAFQQLVDELPGESAPRLALAHACRRGKQTSRAAALFEQILKVDPTATGAAFGLAECRALQHNHGGAAAALALVPPYSPAKPLALAKLSRVLVSPAGGDVQLTELQQAAQAIDALRAGGDSVELRRLSAGVFAAAALALESGTIKEDAQQQVQGIPLQRRRLRRAAEDELRAAARMSPDRAERIQLIDEANRVRPRTFW